MTAHTITAQPGRVTRCRTCAAPIYWCATKRGKLTPLDAEPVPDGEWQIERSPEGLRAVKAGLLPGPRYRVHWATCPQANEHRRAQP